MSNSTLLFIPDISGFTSFVSETEIKHSQHIISELLELIINSDELGMKVSEIEGDAVLFYKEDIPAAVELMEQCRLTFLNFHNHLRRYDMERICRCGACETAANLSLKFIIHKGEVKKINIKSHEKLHGSDVILAHKLLKNSINENEYILMTDPFLKEIDNGINKNGISVKKGQDSYEAFGDVNYSFMPIGDLHDELEEPTPITLPGLSPDKIVVEKNINAPIDIIYENYTNLERRLKWNEDIKEIILHDSGLNKTGSLHTCLVGAYSLDFETIGRMEDNDKIVYSERLNVFKGLRDIISIYTFKKSDDHTHIKVEIDYKFKSLFGSLLKPVVRKMLKKQTEKGLKRLQITSESEISDKE